MEQVQRMLLPNIPSIMKLNVNSWSEDQKQAYIKAWDSSTQNELAKIYSVSRKTINNVNTALGLRKCKSKIAKAYFKPHKTKPKRRKDASPFGTILYSKQKSHYLPSIVTPEGRIRLHIYNWKQAGNEIPEGHILGFKDKNPENCELDNLFLTTRREQLWGDYKALSPKQRKCLTKKEKAAKALKKHQARQEELKRKEEAKAQRSKKKDEARKISEVTKYNSQFKRIEKKLDTRPLNLSAKIAVRIDHKTIIYVNPGDDIEKITARYRKAS
jgi:hypothetical protein